MERRSTASQLKKTDVGRIRGYAAAFSMPTTIRDVHNREFREVILPGAFTRTLKEQPDIRLLRDHQPHQLLGRTKAGTLEVGEDAYGLWFECQLPDTNEGRSVSESIRRGDLDSCSFGFSVVSDNWRSDDMPVRELRDVTLFECSVVCFPAYDQGTSVDLRSKEQDWTKAEEDMKRRMKLTEDAKLRLRIAKAKTR